MFKRLICFGLYFMGTKPLMAFPNICDVVNTPAFLSEFDLQFKPSMCGWPVPRPCVDVSYNVPRYFIEVVGNPKETMFGALPGTVAQLALTVGSPMYAAEDDNGSYSFHAHMLHVPFSQWAMAGMPCGGGMPDLFCFSAMSEHLTPSWQTGSADAWQPEFLAWGLAPKACLLKGAAHSAIGGSLPAGAGASPICSFNMGWLAKYPPTTQPICTGWGIHFPRTGTVTSSDQLTASLVVASRIRSIGAEVFQSVAIRPTDKWQMIYPQTSTGFREGQNVALLTVKGVGEIGRLQGRIKNYLYAVWGQESCTRDLPWVAEAHAWLAAVQAACKAVP